jgi:hypothetical protein
MQKKHSNKSKKISLEQKFSFIAGVIAIVFFTLMAISSIFLQKNLREESQDTRKEASTTQAINNQLAYLNTTTPRPVLISNEKSDMEFLLNTNSNQISGIQLSFTINGNLLQKPVINLTQRLENSLQIVAQNMTQNGNNYSIDLLILPLNPATPISYSSNTSFLRMSIIPANTQDISVVFNNQNSLATRFDTGANILSPIDNMIFLVEEETQDACSAPTNLRASSISCSSTEKVTAIINWDAVAGTKQYEVRLSRTNNPIIDAFEISATTTTNSWNMVNYDDGIWYVNVRVLENGSCSVTGNPNTWQTMVLETDCPASPQCQYGFGDWSACTNGWQTRSYTANPTSCAPPPESSLRRACAEQCRYTYSNWSACTNGWQTRTYSVTPNNCHWYETSDPEILSRRCGDQASNRYLYLYNYESCWYGSSPGNSTYIYWDSTRFQNATWIDISPYSDFREFAHKNISGLNDRYYSYLITTGSGFTWSRSGSPAFTFDPNQTYFVRLYNGTHSQVESFYMPRCAGVGGVTYRLCNESCTSNRDCAPNLSCYNNSCRLASNLESSICAQPPDRGLNRVCNEYCADNNECASGYTCSWNRCRNPRNISDTECRAPSATTQNTTYRRLASLPQVQPDVVKYCNAYCNYNRDCGANFRCYKNQCRLATNPTSSNCSVAQSQEKGDDTANDSTDSSDSANLAEEDSSESTPSTQAQIEETEEEIIEEEDFANQTALDALRDYLKSKGYSMQQIGLMLLGVILAIILLTFLRKLFAKPQVYKPLSTGSSNMPTKTEPAEKSPFSNPKSPVKELVPDYSTASKPPAQISDIEHPIYTQTTVQNQSGNNPTNNPQAGNLGSQTTGGQNNPMLERIKNKGIKMPE